MPGAAPPGELDEPARLPGVWRSLFREGQVLTALLLSSTFSEKYRGRHMKADSVAPIRVPGPGCEKTWHPTLLDRSGRREAVAFVWRGDAARDDRTLYVAFSPLRYRSQFVKVIAGGVADKHRTAAAAATTDAQLGIPLATYLKQKIDRMWGDDPTYNLCTMLLRHVERHPDHRVVFCGISHGAALAQAAALKFKDQQQSADVFVVTWNGYRWTDDSGSRAVERAFGHRFLPLVMSRRRAGPRSARYWDSVAHFPDAMAAMPNVALLDADTGGIIRHRDPSEGTRLGPCSLLRMLELHFAKGALSATRKATELVINAWCAGDPPLHEGAEDLAARRAAGPPAAPPGGRDASAWFTVEAPRTAAAALARPRRRRWAALVSWCRSS